MDIGYVGSANRKQIGYHGLNNAPTPQQGAVDPRRISAKPDSPATWMAAATCSTPSTTLSRPSSPSASAKGLQLLGNYTWGKCMDNQSSLAEGKYQDFIEPRPIGRGRSYDIAHAVQNWLRVRRPLRPRPPLRRRLEPCCRRLARRMGPGGHRASRRPALLPTSALVSTAPTSARQMNGPNVLRNPNIPVGQRTVDRWFDTGAFEMQPSLHLGQRRRLPRA